MRNLWWLLPLTALAPLAVVQLSACGSTCDNGGLGGGTLGVSIAACDAPAKSKTGGLCYQTPSSSTTTSTSTGSGATTGGGSSSSGGANACRNILGKKACDECLEDNCCDTLQVCNNTPHCIECITGAVPDPQLCDVAATSAASTPLQACSDTKCKVQCAPVACNPVTQAECDVGAQEGCDTSDKPGYAFICYPPPNDVGVCGTCDDQAGPYCAPGLHCLPDHGCAAYCCADSDCGSGTCDKQLLGPQLSAEMASNPSSPALVAGSGIGVCVKRQ